MASCSSTLMPARLNATTNSCESIFPSLLISISLNITCNCFSFSRQYDTNSAKSISPSRFISDRNMRCYEQKKTHKKRIKKTIKKCTTKHSICVYEAKNNNNNNKIIVIHETFFPNTKRISIWQ